MIPCIGQKVKTPRFPTVTIVAVLYEDDAAKLGFVESTHLYEQPYNILGRHIGENRMDFAVVLKKERGMPF